MPQLAPFSARRYSLLFWGVLVAAGLLQLGLFGYATGPGLAGTGDSRYYLYAAQALRATGHLLNPDGTAYRFWPPLYPVLLAGAGSLAGIRVLQGACLLGSLLLWSWLGRRVLPARRALALPPLLALSTPWLLVSKFVWAESVFLLLFAAYAVLLFQWLHSGRWGWWGLATAVGLLLPLQRTLGLFLLAGVGAGLLLNAWRTRRPRCRAQLLLHLGLSAAGGMAWQWYALLEAGPSRYHPALGWGFLLRSVADYGFVLSRWLLLLPASGRTLLPNAVWALVLPLLLGGLWPRRPQLAAVAPAAAGGTAPSVPELAETNPRSAPDALRPAAQLLLRALWSAVLALVALVAMLTVFGQSAAGIHDAERYASVLFGPVLLLVLAVWPLQWPRWAGRLLLALWLLGAALRVGHVAPDLRQLKVLPASSFPLPAPHGQGIGAPGQ